MQYRMLGNLREALPDVPFMVRSDTEDIQLLKQMHGSFSHLGRHGWL
jgi:hypothetical protein